MELIPQKIKDQIPKLYETENQIEPIAYVKLFIDGWTWFITEISIDKNICFGYVISPFCSGELGYFSLEEIKNIKEVISNIKSKIGLFIIFDSIDKPKQYKIKKISDTKNTIKLFDLTNNIYFKE